MWSRSLVQIQIQKAPQISDPAKTRDLFSSNRNVSCDPSYPLLQSLNIHWNKSDIWYFSSIWPHFTILCNSDSFSGGAREHWLNAKHKRYVDLYHLDDLSSLTIVLDESVKSYHGMVGVYMKGDAYSWLTINSIKSRAFFPLHLFTLYIFNKQDVLPFDTWLNCDGWK